MKKNRVWIALLVILTGSILFAVFFRFPPQLEMERAEDLPVFGEQTETKTESEEENFFVSPANSYFGKELYEAALNSEKTDEDGVQHLPVFKMETKGELDAFRASFGDSLAREGEEGKGPGFSEVVKRYDDAFFEKNALFIVYVTPDSGSYRYGVEKIVSEGEELSVSVVQTNRPQAVTMDLVGWLITVEEEKDVLAGKNSFDATLTRPK